MTQGERRALLGRLEGGVFMVGEAQPMEDVHSWLGTLPLPAANPLESSLATPVRWLQ